jgi:hypothetical protein
MNRILKSGEYLESLMRGEEFISFFDGTGINESSRLKSEFNKISKRLSKDLKFNFKLIATFGSGIKLMIPVVEGLIKNGNIQFELTPENLILLTITIAALIYLEETGNQAGGDVNDKGEKSIFNKSDAQTLLEELRMRGIGGGIVKKFVSAFNHIKNFLSKILKGTQYIIGGLLEMFGYTALMIPCMNAISMFVGKYDITLENIGANLLSLGVGVGAIVSKMGVQWLSNKIKNLLNLGGDSDDVDIDVGDGGVTLIKEQ